LSNTLSNNSNEATVRQYSSFLAPDNNVALLKQFEIMLKSNRNHIIEQTAEVVKQESISIQNRIEKIMQQNNF
jgi:hypothetical protein